VNNRIVGEEEQDCGRRGVSIIMVEEEEGKIKLWMRRRVLSVEDK